MKKILVVDDNEENLYLLKTLLESSGYDIVTAADGEEALEIAHQESPTLIISDILMPVMDGFTLCRTWRADDALRNVPFVFYTATYTDVYDEEFAEKLGADRFLRKPTDPDEFLAMVRDVLEQEPFERPSASPPPDESDEVHLRQYNQVLLRKLEDKMAELEEANRLLEQRVVERTSELEERNQTLEAFAYSMAHDLGAPLRGIRGFAGILQDDEKDVMSEAGRENVQTIIDASDLLGQMMSDLLRYATMGSSGLGMGPVDLSHVIQRIQLDLEVRLKEANATLIVPADLPNVYGEQTLLNQIFSNLIRNGLTYCRPDQRPRVEMSFKLQADRVVVAVADNGIGIRPDDCAQIFTLFRRLNSQEHYPGSGVGLGIVDRAVRLLGGRVWVESEYGVGSTFFVELPMA